MADYYSQGSTNPVGSSDARFYGDLINIDLREELHGLLFGNAALTPQGRPFIIRTMTDVKCPGCWDTSSGGPRSDCVYCQGEGYEWTESQWVMWMARGVAPIYKPGFLASGQYPQAQYGYTDPNRATVYCEYNVFLNYERYVIPTNPAPDKLYELKVNTDGSQYFPVVRAAKWKILNVSPLHGDFGRIEFFELSLDKEVIS